MRAFIAGCFVALAIFGIYRLTTHDYDNEEYFNNVPSWNSDCQYGDEYMMPDGTVVQHSECK